MGRVRTPGTCHTAPAVACVRFAGRIDVGYLDGFGDPELRPKIKFIIPRAQGNAGVLERATGLRYPLAGEIVPRIRSDALVRNRYRPDKRPRGGTLDSYFLVVECAHAKADIDHLTADLHRIDVGDTKNGWIRVRRASNSSEGSSRDQEQPAEHRERTLHKDTLPW